MFAYKRNGVEPPKKIRQRGASVTFGLLPLTIGNSFAKTQSFSFRCRCAGANLREMRSIAPPQQQANVQCRRLSVARKSITRSIGAAAVISASRVGLPRAGNRTLHSLIALPVKTGFLGGKRYERERVLCVRSRIRVFSLSAFLHPFCAHKKDVALGAKPPAERPQDAPLRFAGVTANLKKRLFTKTS